MRHGKKPELGIAAVLLLVCAACPSSYASVNLVPKRSINERVEVARFKPEGAIWIGNGLKSQPNRISYPKVIIVNEDGSVSPLENIGQLKPGTRIRALTSLSIRERLPDAKSKYIKNLASVGVLYRDDECSIVELDEQGSFEGNRYNIDMSNFFRYWVPITRQLALKRFSTEVDRTQPSPNLVATAKAMADKGQYLDARKTIDPLLDEPFFQKSVKETDQADAALLLSEICQWVGEYDRSIRFAQQATQFQSTAKTDAKSLFLIGECEYARSHFDKAIELLKSSMEKEPKNTDQNFESALILAESYALKGFFEKASRELAPYEYLLEESDSLKTARLLCELARMDSRNGKPTDAMKKIDRALSIFDRSDLPRNHPWLSQAYLQKSIESNAFLKYDDYRKYCKLAVEAIDSSTGTNSFPSIETHYTESKVQSSSGAQKDSDENGAKLLYIAKNSLGSDSLLVAFLLEKAAGKESRDGNFDAAMKGNLESLEIEKRALGPVNPDVAITLQVIGNLEFRFGENEKGKKSLLESLAISEKLFGAESCRIASTLTALAAIERSSKNFAEADRLLKRSIAVQSLAYGQDSPNVASALLEVGKLRIEEKKERDAVLVFKNALEILQKSVGLNHKTTLLAMKKLADTLVETRETAEAERLFREIISASSSTEFLATEERTKLGSSALISLANVCQDQKRDGETLTLITQFLSENSKTLDDATKGLLLTKLAQCEERAGHPEPAAEHYLAAIASIEQDNILTRTKKSFQKQEIYRSLIPLLSKENKLNEVSKLLMESIQEKDSYYGREYLGTADDLQELAKNSIKQDNLEEALKAQKEACRILDKTLEPMHPKAVDAKLELGSIYEQLNRLDMAAETYDSAKKVITSIKDKSMPEIYERLGKIEIKRKNIPEAQRYIKYAIDIQPDRKDLESLYRDLQQMDKTRI